MALLGCGEFRITIDGKIDSCIDGENDEVDEITAVPDIQGKNGVLYIDGVSKGPLTPEQQEQLKQYQQEVKEWNKALQQSIQSVSHSSSLCFTHSCIFSRTNTSLQQRRVPRSTLTY
ncbi:hypothetical protein Tcan_17937 [Toxocara canis]|uniref:Pepsin inhibitor-3-like repeated domain-containing protein n=1 Tax=Toxocara canis TaxID=6265 RepID=A0A0B2VRA6_TOXCA|nr:hypothetical protein Tcan_17937 [Toxocara canis]